MTPPEEVIGRSVHERLPAARRRGDSRRRPARRRPSRRCSSIEYTMSLRGEERDYEGRIVACGPDEFVLIVRDFTERRAAGADSPARARLQPRGRPLDAELPRPRGRPGHAARREPGAGACRRNPRGVLDRTSFLDALHRRGRRPAGAGGLHADARGRPTGRRRVRARRARRRAARRRLDSDASSTTPRARFAISSAAST